MGDVERCGEPGATGPPSTPKGEVRVSPLRGEKRLRMVTHFCRKEEEVPPRPPPLLERRIPSFERTFGELGPRIFGGGSDVSDSSLKSFEGLSSRLRRSAVMSGWRAKPIGRMGGIGSEQALSAGDISIAPRSIK